MRKFALLFDSAHGWGVWTTCAAWKSLINWAALQWAAWFVVDYSQWLVDWLTASWSWLKAATLFRISFSLPRSGISDTLPWRVSGNSRLTRLCWSPSWGHTLPSYFTKEEKPREDRHVTILQYNTTTLWGNYLNHLTWSWWGLLISVVLFYLLSLLQFLKLLHRCLVFTRNSQFSQITTKEIKQIITHLNDLLQIFHLSAGVQGGTYLNTEKCSIPLSHFWLGLTAEIPANK